MVFGCLGSIGFLVYCLLEGILLIHPHPWLPLLKSLGGTELEMKMFIAIVTHEGDMFIVKHLDPINVLRF